jgi:hypothetical protein
VKTRLSIRKLLTGIGIRHKDFSVAFSLSDVSEIERFVAREEELAEMHKTLSGDGSRRTIVLHGLGGIGKTPLFWQGPQARVQKESRVIRERKEGGRAAADRTGTDQPKRTNRTSSTPVSWPLPTHPLTHYYGSLPHLGHYCPTSVLVVLVLSSSSLDNQLRSHLLDLLSLLKRAGASLFDASLSLYNANCSFLVD